MPSLAEFQSGFVRDLTSGTPPESCAYANPAFAVYRNTWRKALRDALQANYPVVAMLIGEEGFHTLATHYIGDSGPSSPVLAGYGDGLADLIAASPLAEMVPYLTDMARLEHHVAEVRDAPDARPIAPDFFSRLAPHAAETLTLSLAPTARLIRAETPAITIWKAHQGPDKPKGLSPDWKAEPGLVARQGNGVTVDLLDDPTFAFASALDRGEPLGATAAETLAQHPEADIAAILTSLAMSNAFTAL